MGFATVCISTILRCMSVASFIPSLKLIVARRRHFEVFIAVLQIFATVCFDITSGLQLRLFGVGPSSYHHVSDITSETYICLILIHLCGLRDEELMMKLRYTAFGLIWFAKLGDGWESIFLEALVLMLFSIPPLTLLLYSTFKPKTKIRHVPLEKTGDNLIDGAFKFLNGATRNLPYDPNSKLYALATTVVGLILLYLENCMDNEIKIFHALASVSFGTGTYFLWTVLPCYEKDNILGSTYR